jgi:hypothetical protein
MKYSNVKIAIIGRDKTILEYQQKRVRGEKTTDHFINHLEYLIQYDPVFLSQELYQLYGNHYLQAISKQLNFPIEHQKIYKDENKKYIQYINKQPLDVIIQKVSNES